MIRLQWATKVVETLLGKDALRYLGKVHLIWQGGGDEDIEGGLRKFLGTRKGGSEKIRGGGSKNLCRQTDRHVFISGLRPSSDAVLHMSWIECKWGRTKDFAHLHSIRLMWSTASEPGLKQRKYIDYNFQISKNYK